MVAILWAMHVRQQEKIFPFFFAYIGFVVVKNVVDFAMLEAFGLYSIAYYCVYMIGSFGAIGISFFALYELVKHILTSGTIKVPKWVSVLLVLFVSIGSLYVASFLVTRSLHNMNLFRVVLFCEGAARVAQISVLLCCLILSAFFGLYWESQAFGIAAGYGFHALVILTVFALRKIFGFQIPVDLSSVSYTTAVLIWLRYSLRNAEVPWVAQLPRLPRAQESAFTRPLISIFR